MSENILHPTVLKNNIVDIFDDIACDNNVVKKEYFGMGKQSYRIILSLLMVVN